jgi:DNA-binding response OmpR family regulator
MTNKKTILIVDDEKNIRGALEIILSSAGYEVFAAENGKQALSMLKTGQVKPQLAILDMFMPELSGRETAEQIRKNSQLKDIKIVFLTVARFSEVGKREIQKLNISDYITKPFDNDDLLKRVKKVLD